MGLNSVSILMSFHNGRPFLRESIESILGQDFGDFEFVIVDDGSVDGGAEIVEEYARYDPRLRFFRKRNNEGLAAALNYGLGLSRAPYIVRMDADDVALPHRVSTLFRYMCDHPDVDVAGSWLELYEEPGAVWRSPIGHEAIAARMLFESSIFHPTVIYKRDVVHKQFGGYAASMLKAQDYDLWGRILMGGGRFANIAEPLLRYRVHSGTDRSKIKIQQRSFANDVRERLSRQLLGRANGVLCHAALSYPLEWVGSPPLAECSRWLDDIYIANGVRHFAADDCLRAELEARWSSLCMRGADDDFFAVLEYFKGGWGAFSFRGFCKALVMVWRSVRRHWVF